MPPSPDSTPVAGADDSLLAAVASMLPALPDVRADVSDRFAQGVRSLAETRARAAWPNEDVAHDVAAFVYVDRPREVGRAFSGVPVLDPVATQFPLLGRLFFMNRDASAGQSIVLPVNPDAILDWLSDNGLATRPLIMVYRNAQLMTRRNGVEGPARSDVIRTVAPEATIQELGDMLAHFHTQQLTPSVCTAGIWQKGRASEYIPGTDPEKVIQRAMAVATNYWFRGVVRAEIEDPVPIGRIDIRLLKKSAVEGSLAYWAIVELKVIKSFANADAGAATKVGATANIAAIVKGIDQAWAFRGNREAEEGLLEVFDLRLDKSDDLMVTPDVKGALAKCDPTPAWVVRPLFGSSEDARSAGFDGAV